MCEINQLIHALVYSDWKQIVSYTMKLNRSIEKFVKSACTGMQHGFLLWYIFYPATLNFKETVVIGKNIQFSKVVFFSKFLVASVHPHQKFFPPKQQNGKWTDMILIIKYKKNGKKENRWTSRFRIASVSLPHFSGINVFPLILFSANDPLGILQHTVLDTTLKTN